MTALDVLDRFVGSAASGLAVCGVIAWLVLMAIAATPDDGARSIDR